VVGRLCLDEAREGGDSLLVSAVTMFDRLANDPRLDFTMRVLHRSAAPWRRRVAVRLTRPGLSPVKSRWVGRRRTGERRHCLSAQACNAGV
jgi:hypothetical protein